MYSDYFWGVDDTGYFHVLYTLEGTDRRFKLLLGTTHGEPTAEDGELHLPRFLALRGRLRAVFPALAQVPDALLAGLLGAVGDTDAYAVGYITASFAFMRQLDQHPERGDGKSTEVERKLGELDGRKEGFLPQDVGTGRGDDVLPSDPADMYEGPGWRNMQGLCYPGLGRRSLTSTMEKAVALLTAFHRSA